MAFHMYVDESKTPNYLLMGVLVDESQVVELRAAMRSLLLPGQERIHFKHESDSRKRTILETIRRAGVDAVVSFGTHVRHDSVARQECLKALVGEVQLRGVTRLILEQEDSSVDTDRRALYGEFRQNHHEHVVSYGWSRPRAEPLLWLPDALAWSWAKGGAWKQLASRSCNVSVAAPR